MKPNSKNNLSCFVRGLKAGIPIGLGYLAVSFTLGIAARNAGLTAFQATLSSLLTNASAGEFVGFTLIAANAGYFEIALMELIANARYFLMSCALSQKLDSSVGLGHRLLIGWYVTDEVFAVSIAEQGKLNPCFTYGAIVPACIGWASGTCLGVIMGNILPSNIVSALSVGLYGMFIAIFVPPAKENKVVRLLVLISMLLSLGFSVLPFVKELSSGLRIIILTVLIAGGAAVLAPVREEDEHDA